MMDVNVNDRNVPILVIIQIVSFLFCLQVLSRNGFECDGLDTMCIKDQTLTNQSTHILCNLLDCNFTHCKKVLF